MLLTPTVDMWQSQRVNISEVCVYSSWKISSYTACNWKYLRLENRIINCEIHSLPCCIMTKTFQKVTSCNVKICYLFSENQDVRQKFIRKMATLWKMGDWCWASVIWKTGTVSVSQYERSYILFLSTYARQILKVFSSWCNESPDLQAGKQDTNEINKLTIFSPKTIAKQLNAIWYLIQTFISAAV